MMVCVLVKIALVGKAFEFVHMKEHGVENPALTDNLSVLKRNAETNFSFFSSLNNFEI